MTPLTRLTPDAQNDLTRYLEAFQGALLNQPLHIEDAWRVLGQLLGFVGQQDLNINELRLHYVDGQLPLMGFVNKVSNTVLTQAQRIALLDRVSSAGGDVNMPGDDGCVPLHHAARKNLQDVVKWLLEAGAFVNQQSHSKQTALHRAARAGHIGVVQTLLEHGATVDVPDDQGQRPLDLAQKHQYNNVVQLLYEAGSALPSKQSDAALLERKAHRDQEMFDGQGGWEDPAISRVSVDLEPTSHVLFNRLVMSASQQALKQICLNEEQLDFYLLRIWNAVFPSTGYEYRSSPGVESLESQPWRKHSVSFDHEPNAWVALQWLTQEAKPWMLMKGERHFKTEAEVAQWVEEREAWADQLKEIQPGHSDMEVEEETFTLESREAAVQRVRNNVGFQTSSEAQMGLAAQENAQELEDLEALDKGSEPRRVGGLSRPLKEKMALLKTPGIKAFTVEGSAADQERWIAILMWMKNSPVLNYRSDNPHFKVSELEKRAQDFFAGLGAGRSITNFKYDSGASPSLLKQWTPQQWKNVNKAAREKVITHFQSPKIVRLGREKPIGPGEHRPKESSALPVTENYTWVEVQNAEAAVMISHQLNQTIAFPGSTITPNAKDQLQEVRDSLEQWGWLKGPLLPLNKYHASAKKRLKQLNLNVPPNYSMLGRLDHGAIPLSQKQWLFVLKDGRDQPLCAMSVLVNMHGEAESIEMKASEHLRRDPRLFGASFAPLWKHLSSITSKPLKINDNLLSKLGWTNPLGFGLLGPHEKVQNRAGFEEWKKSLDADQYSKALDLLAQAGHLDALKNMLPGTLQGEKAKVWARLKKETQAEQAAKINVWLDRCLIRGAINMEHPELLDWVQVKMEQEIRQKKRNPLQAKGIWIDYFEKVAVQAIQYRKIEALEQVFNQWKVKRIDPSFVGQQIMNKEGPDLPMLLDMAISTIGIHPDDGAMIKLISKAYRFERANPAAEAAASRLNGGVIRNASGLAIDSNDMSLWTSDRIHSLWLYKPQLLVDLIQNKEIPLTQEVVKTVWGSTYHQKEHDNVPLAEVLSPDQLKYHLKVNWDLILRKTEHQKLFQAALKELPSEDIWRWSVSKPLDGFLEQWERLAIEAIAAQKELMEEGPAASVIDDSFPKTEEPSYLEIMLYKLRKLLKTHPPLVTLQAEWNRVLSFDSEVLMVSMPLLKLLHNAKPELKAPVKVWDQLIVQKLPPSKWHEALIFSGLAEDQRELRQLEERWGWVPESEKNMQRLMACVPPAHLLRCFKKVSENIELGLVAQNPWSATLMHHLLQKDPVGFAKIIREREASPSEQEGDGVWSLADIPTTDDLIQMQEVQEESTRELSEESTPVKSSLAPFDAAKKNISDLDRAPLEGSAQRIHDKANRVLKGNSDQSDLKVKDKAQSLSSINTMPSIGASEMEGDLLPESILNVSDRRRLLKSQWDSEPDTGSLKGAQHVNHASSSSTVKVKT